MLEIQGLLRVRSVLRGLVVGEARAEQSSRDLSFRHEVQWGLGLDLERLVVLLITLLEEF